MVIWFTSRYQKNVESQNLYLTISGNQTSGLDLKIVVEVLKKYCSEIKLKRTDETPLEMEASFFVGFENFENLEKAKSELKSLDSSLKITFMDNTRDI